MSGAGKNKTTKAKSPSHAKASPKDLHDTDFSVNGNDANNVEQKTKPKVGRPQALSQNAVVKSRLAVVIDELRFDDTVDEKAMRRSVSIALKHLLEVEEML